MAYSSIVKPTDYFNTVLYNGNDASSHAITGVGFQPDWVWIKARNSTKPHCLFDPVRGVQKFLSSDSNGSETSDSTTLLSFDSDGFTIGASGKINAAGHNDISWNWKAGNSSGSSNSDGSITSTVSANTTAGFSIVQFVGNETSGDTVGHGLGSVPAMIIIKKKSTSSSQDWVVNHKGLANQTQAHLTLNTTNASGNNTTLFDNTAPTSSVFSVGANSATNASGATYIAYCFAEKKGYSRFGSYTGNGLDDGPFVYTGFKPAFVLGKRTDNAGGWWMSDNKRSNGFNLNDEYLISNSSNTEQDDGSFASDFLANGWKARATNGNFNADDGTYVYMALAENPFVANDSGTAVPVTAR